MITILPADKAFLESVSAPAHAEAMVLREGDGHILGHALFCLEGEQVEILAVEAVQPLLLDGLIRSVLNTGDCRGAKVGIFRVEALETILRRLEFDKTDAGDWCVSIDKFFRGDGCCCQ